ncbi:hypothetical protein HK098_007080 [Nowakowskiella sp. JEL0407]|nr:hypothetical protein HK098_007080 [Nowakowskiella sp. JEL0407]
MSDYYDVFLSYRVKTDAGNARIVFYEFRADHDKNTKVFLDNVELKLGTQWKPQFLDALKNSRVCIPLISNAFIDKLELKEGDEDNVLLEWDTMLDRFHNGDCRIIPLFLKDGNVDLDITKADEALKDVKAKGCKRTARDIWNSFKEIQGRPIDLKDLNQVKLFVIQTQLLYLFNLMLHKQSI